MSVWSMLGPFASDNAKLSAQLMSMGVGMVFQVACCPDQAFKKKLRYQLWKLLKLPRV